MTAPVRAARVVTADPMDSVDADLMRERIERYLPANYGVASYGRGIYTVLIVGTDDAGWTLDGYVLPRLASGNIHAQEVSL